MVYAFVAPESFGLHQKYMFEPKLSDERAHKTDNIGVFNSYFIIFSKYFVSPIDTTALRKVSSLMFSV